MKLYRAIHTIKYLSSEADEFFRPFQKQQTLQNREKLENFTVRGCDDIIAKMHALVRIDERLQRWENYD